VRLRGEHVGHERAERVELAERVGLRVERARRGVRRGKQPVAAAQDQGLV
jgi:hypothetical protein